MKNHIDKLIPQIYCIEDLKYCINNNFNNCICALWKIYGNIFDNKTINFILELSNYEKQINIMGITVFFHNYNDITKFNSWKNKVNHTIYFHGQNISDNEINYFNQKSIYFFKH